MVSREDIAGLLLLVDPEIELHENVLAPDAAVYRGPEGLRKWLETSAEAFADFRRGFSNPATIHAMCEDYRAVATIDVAHDAADRCRQRIACPVLVLWGRQGPIDAWYDVPAVWRAWAADVRGRALDCGHHLALEAPDATYAELAAFFAD